MKLLMRLPPCGVALLLAVLWVAPLWSQATGGTVQGFVTDSANSRAVQGAVVSYGGKTAVSRIDGKYVLADVRAGTDTLRVRTIGYKAHASEVTVAAGETVTVDVPLAAQAVDLTEMVVVGYGEQRAADITGAVTNVTSDEFNTGRVVTPTELIQNKVAGVQVIENNEPGGATTIRVRGATSINANSDPLFVVDGVPLSSGGGINLGAGSRDPLNFLNASDIESITVLRDASAASIYGANAANGVVLITTKRGKGGAPRFEYSGSVSSSRVTKVPSMLNAAQFRAAVTEFAPGSVAQLGSANTNWFDQVTQSGFGQEQNFAMSGSTNSSNYRFSANYLDQEGVVFGTNTKRITLGVNYDQRLMNDALSLKFNLRGSRAEDKFTPGGVLGNAAQMGPTQPVFDSTTPTGYYDWAVNIQSADNPVALSRLARNEGTTLRSVGNMQAAYNIPKLTGLTANLNLGYDVTRGERVNFEPSTLHGQLRNGNYGNYNRQNPSQTNTVVETFANYAVPNEVGPGLLDLTAGYSFSESHSEFPSTSADSLATDLLGTGAIPAAKTIKSTQFINDSRLISLFARANYNIDSRYLFNVSVRRDGSSRFGPDNQWGTFPSAAAAWRISEESFLKGKFNLSDLKLRASWAKTGNQSFGDFLYLSSYTSSNAQAQYYMGADGFVSTIRPSAVDPNIKWEATRSVDLGLDFGFDNQRFTGAIDYYHKKTTDLIFSVPAAAGTVPGDFVTTNIGTMRNRGFEFSLGARILEGNKASGGGLVWQADFTAARNENQLQEITPFGGVGQQILTGGISGGVGQTIQVLRPGYAVNSFYVLKQRYAAGKPVYGTPLEMYEDLNEDGQINQDDYRPYKSPQPKWILGHSSYLTYNKFDLGFTLRAYLGNYVYNNVASTLGTYSEVTRASPFNLHKSVLETGFETQQLFSDYYVEKASFLRMDNMTLGYSLNLKGQPARIYGAVQNVFTITGYSGIDPAAGLNGIDNNLYPRSRTFSGGLSLQF
jgi:iron complex outermembrane receptor protein